jgi:hypothetical protein
LEEKEKKKKDGRSLIQRPEIFWKEIIKWIKKGKIKKLVKWKQRFKKVMLKNLAVSKFKDVFWVHFNSLQKVDKLIETNEKFKEDLLNSNLEDIMENTNLDKIAPLNEIVALSKVCAISIQKHGTDKQNGKTTPKSVSLQLESTVRPFIASHRAYKGLIVFHSIKNQKLI